MATLPSKAERILEVLREISDVWYRADPRGRKTLERRWLRAVDFLILDAINPDRTPQKLLLDLREFVDHEIRQSKNRAAKVLFPAKRAEFQKQRAIDQAEARDGTPTEKAKEAVAGILGLTADNVGDAFYGPRKSATQRRKKSRTK